MPKWKNQNHRSDNRSNGKGIAQQNKGSPSTLAVLDHRCAFCEKRFSKRTELSAHRNQEHFERTNAMFHPGPGRPSKPSPIRRSQVQQGPKSSKRTATFASAGGGARSPNFDVAIGPPVEVAVAVRASSSGSGSGNLNMVLVPKRWWICQFCKKTLGRKETLEKHIQTFHKSATISMQIPLPPPSPSQQLIQQFAQPQPAERKLKNLPQVRKLRSSSSTVNFKQQNRIAVNLPKNRIAKLKILNSKQTQKQGHGHGVMSKLPCPHPHCPKLLSSKWTLVQHVRIHSGEKPYRCPTCPMRFLYWYSKYNHVKNCPGKTAAAGNNRNGNLQISVKRVKTMTTTLTTTAPTMTREEKDALLVQRLTCRHCRQIFCTPMYARCHQLRCKILQLKCHICSRVMSNKLSLEDHVRRHNGERPYSCRICHKSFASLKNLPGHRRKCAAAALAARRALNSSNNEDGPNRNQGKETTAMVKTRARQSSEPSRSPGNQNLSAESLIAMTKSPICRKSKKSSPRNELDGNYSPPRIPMAKTSSRQQSNTQPQQSVSGLLKRINANRNRFATMIKTSEAAAQKSKEPLRSRSRPKTTKARPNPTSTITMANSPNRKSKEAESRWRPRKSKEPAKPVIGANRNHPVGMTTTTTITKISAQISSVQSGRGREKVSASRIQPAAPTMTTKTKNSSGTGSESQQSQSVSQQGQGPSSSIATAAVASNSNLASRQIPVLGKQTYFICRLCNKMFSSRYSFTSHVALQHSAKIYFPCPKCLQQFKFRMALRRHLKSVCAAGAGGSKTAEVNPNPAAAVMATVKATDTPAECPK